MAITSAIEMNKTILKVGLHFEFGDCRLVANFWPSYMIESLQRFSYFKGIVLLFSFREISTQYGFRDYQKRMCQNRQSLKEELKKKPDEVIYSKMLANFFYF